MCVAIRVFGSGSVLDPDSVRSVDPDDLYSESGSGSMRAKMTQKNRKKIEKFDVVCSLLRAEGFFCNLGVFYRGLEIGKL